MNRAGLFLSLLALLFIVPEQLLAAEKICTYCYAGHNGDLVCEEVPCQDRENSTTILEVVGRRYPKEESINVTGTAVTPPSFAWVRAPEASLDSLGQR